MGPLILGIILGLAIGAGLVYWTLQQKIDQHQTELRQYRNALAEMEQVHESRLREMTQSLQADYQRQLTAEKQSLNHQHEAELQALRANHARAIEEIQHAQPPAPEPTQESVPETDPETDQATAADSELESDVKPPQIRQSIAASAPPRKAETYSSASDISEQDMQDAVKQRHPDLAETILSWGNAGQTAYLPQVLQFYRHRDRQVRESVATATGQLVKSKLVSAEIQRAIPVLGTLSRDSDPAVRQAAIQSLGQIRSEQVVPFLEKALRDSDRNVVKSASAAMNRYKFYPSKPKSNSAKRNPQQTKRQS